MNVGIYSYAHSSLNDEIAFYQKRVFDKFSIPLQQIISSDDHAAALEKIIRDSHEECLVIFDVDCIPLNTSFLPKIYEQIKPLNVLAGAIQCANHINKHKPYIGPCFCGFSKTLYKECGSPSLSAWEGGDVMQKFTDECQYLQRYCQIKILFWMPTHPGDSLWDLEYQTDKFGHGTIYEGLIYHQFEIRHHQQHEQFIGKCKEIIRKFSSP